jgi:hypothetical protein
MQLAPVPGQSFTSSPDHSHRRPEHPFPRSPSKASASRSRLLADTKGSMELLADRDPEEGVSCPTRWSVTCRIPALLHVAQHAGVCVGLAGPACIANPRRHTRGALPNAERAASGDSPAVKHPGSGYPPMVPSPSPQPIEIADGYPWLPNCSGGQV